MGFKEDVLQFINGFRKWTVMILLILLASVFRIFDYISGKEMVDLLRYVGVAFMATNGLEHMMKAVKTWVQKKV